MKTTNEGQARQLAHGNRGLCSVGQLRVSMLLLILLATCTIVGTAHAQTVIGSSGAGWQTWTLGDNNTILSDLNDNGAPYWDVAWEVFSNTYGGTPADKNAGFCMTSTGDCQGLGSGALAPGALPFWGQPYISASDTGGARDNTVYFRSTGGRLRATLYLNFSANPTEINEFGWFETNATGASIGNRHILFQGSGEPTGSLTPDPVGKTVTFSPTRYFGYYYSDVSEPACPDGTDQPCADPNAILHGCYANTLFNLNDARCTEAGGNQGDHDLVVFKDGGSSLHPNYWVVGEDPTDCANQDGDCNLTIVKVVPVLSN